LDTDAGLRIANGNRRLYRRLLIKFRGNQRDFIRTFQRALDDKDPVVAERLAHTLKGVAGNLGMRSVEKTARDLELACAARNPREIEVPLQAVEHYLDQVIAGLAGLDVEAGTRESTSADCGAICVQLRHLRELLESCDTGAGAALESLAATASLGPHAHALERISRMLEDYDFDSALAEFGSLEPTLRIAAADTSHQPVSVVDGDQPLIPSGVMA